MKRHSRIAACILAAVIIFSSIPAVAAPRERDRDVPSTIIRVIKKFQKLFGIQTQEDDHQLIPPRP